MKFLWLVVGLAACDQVLGIDQFPIPPPVMPGTTITGRLVRQVVHNDASFRPGTDEIPMTSATAMLRADSDLTLAADGAFSFVAATVPYQLEISLDQEHPFELQSSAPTLDITDVWLGRTPRTAITSQSTITETLPNAPASGFDVLQSTGLWASYTVPGTSSSQFSVDWRTATPTIGTIGLLDSSLDDQLYTLHYVFLPDGLGTYYAIIDNYRVDNVTLADAGTVPVTGDFTALQGALCTHLIAPEGSEADRVIAVDAGYRRSGGAWTVTAMPAGAANITALAYLAGQGLAQDTDEDVASVRFGNPFPGTTVVATLYGDVVRDIRFQGLTPLAFGGGIQETVAVSSDGACTSTTKLGGDLAVPAHPTFAGTPLDTDDQMIQIDRSQPLELRLSLAMPGLADYTNVALWAVGANGNATGISLVRSYLTTEDQVLIDPKLFVAGATYFFDVAVHAGLPNAKLGDQRTRTLPLGFAEVASRTFQIVN